ncbi:CRISPR-associated helicase/endonuclease Cas3 [Streptomyces sodiiphilus]|uniref:CRISPR-associated helicase/endonuclease Cas3 n=1 Tax=Streptomyces sodiiphilus TaxID=226217 RepID=A0ABN2P6Q7_9ACTN
MSDEWGGVALDIEGMLGSLWGKSAEKAGGRKNLLLSHLFDTAAVAELMWEGFLAPSTRLVLDDIAGGPGAGKKFFAWLCGVHDCGKATPAFQRMWPEGAAEVRKAGLTWHDHLIPRKPWRHDRAGGHLLCRDLAGAGWTEEQIDWLWPLVAGHHGRFPSRGELKPANRAKGQLVGTGSWPAVQRALLERFTEGLGFEGVAAVAPARKPSRAVQLHLSGLIVMADWIASDEKYFRGVDDLRRVTLEAARERAGEAWLALGLHQGWGGHGIPGQEAFRERFGQEPRPSQMMVIEAAGRMSAPGLLLVEAPMGEGKTKAALLAAEVLAARFGADGVFVGMPTQATSDPMFSEVRKWLSRIDEELPSRVALLHGKRMFNPEWRALLEGSEADDASRFGGVDEYGECLDDDLYGAGTSDWEDRTPAPGTGARGPADWFLGTKRGLLCPFVVGTIDQLLLAATRTKHVMLRMAGLMGKVVVLDEVHAADVHMSQFLMEGLRWLGQAGVPVVLLSATLPPRQRQDLVTTYLAGASSREEYVAHGLPETDGYPSVTAAWPSSRSGSVAEAGGVPEPQYLVACCSGWRTDLSLSVDLLGEVVPPPHTKREDREAAEDGAARSVVDLLERELNAGGCVLIIRSSVPRAQRLYRLLRDRYGDEVHLLHGRLAVGERADRTARCLRLLGPPQGVETGERPGRMILVATQLAEQSFDVDVDLLVTDLAPIDLLLQRIGRLHRHAGVSRPAGLTAPRVVITGVDAVDLAAPQFPGVSEAIYGRFLLLRSAALVRRALASTEGTARGSGWRVPAQVPELVAAGYDVSDALLPPQWLEAAEAAHRQWEKTEGERAEKASQSLLTRRGDKEGSTLAGLHYAGRPESGGDATVEWLVRDGSPTVEAILVVRKGEVHYTLNGRALSVNGDVGADLLEDVLAGTVRLPPSLTESALKELRPLPGWFGHARLRHCPALLLDHRGRTVLGDHDVSYDPDLGLLVQRLVTN